TGAQEVKKKPLPDPTPRRDAILKLFVEEFLAITPGTGKFPESFMMGTEKGGHDNERPAHKVTFKYSFAIAKYEVTQELYHVVVGRNPAEFQGLRNGIDKVNWHEANEFCQRATNLLRERKFIAEKERIRLPSESEGRRIRSFSAMNLRSRRRLVARWQNSFASCQLTLSIPLRRP